MSHSYYSSPALRKIQEVREKYQLTEETDEKFDELDFMIKQRIQRDNYKLDEASDAHSQHRRDCDQREIMGSSTWTERKLARGNERREFEKSLEKPSLPEEIEKKRFEREARKDEVRELASVNSDIDEMKRRWASDDDRRAKEAAEDTKYEREKKWARQDAKKESIRRERERFREERELRIEQLAVQKDVREKEYQSNQTKDSLDVDHWQKKIVTKKLESDRAIRRATEPLNNPINPDDPYSYLSFLNTSKKKSDVREHRRRLKETEEANESMKQWYLDRNFERGEAKIRADRFTFSSY